MQVFDIHLLLRFTQPHRFVLAWLLETTPKQEMSPKGSEEKILGRNAPLWRAAGTDKNYCYSIFYEIANYALPQTKHGIARTSIFHVDHPYRIITTLSPLSPPSFGLK